MSTSVPPVPGAAWHPAAVGVAAVAVGLLLPAGPWRSGTEVVVFLVAVAAVCTALRVHHPFLVRTWQALAVALTALAGSAVAETLESAGVAAAVTGTWEAGLDLAGYLAVAVAALAAMAGGRRRDWDAWADTASLVIVAAMAVAVLTEEGARFGRGLSELLVGMPLITAVVLISCVRLAMVGNGRSPSGIALLGAGALALTGFTIRIVADGHVPAVLDALPVLAVVAIAFAARHPSVAVLGRGADPGSTMTTGRLFGLGAALLASPVLLLLWALYHGGSSWLLAIGTGGLTVLALWRLGRINAEREQIRTALAASEARLRLLLANAADVIAIVDVDGRLTYVSPAVETLLGRTPADLLGIQAVDLLEAHERDRLCAAVRVRGAGPVDADVRLRDAVGASRWVELKISDRVAATGVDGWVVNLREITDRKGLEDELRHRATTDPLTGLANRAEFWRLLDAATAVVRPDDAPTVLFVDLDGFKQVNDSYGHAAGDDLLVAVAGRLRSCVRGGDVVARLGGDEFALLLGPGNAARADDVATRVVARLRLPVQLTGGTVVVTASVGVARAVPGDSPESVLHRADTAMYGAKTGGKDSHLTVSAGPLPAGA